MADLYAILGLGKNASKQEIKQAYKKLAFRFHPDQNPHNPAAEEKFKLINEAYHILSDEYKKMNYDFTQSQSTNSPASIYQAYRQAQYRQNPYASGVPEEEITPRTKKRLYLYSFIFFIIFIIFAVYFHGFMNNVTARQHYQEALESFSEKKYINSLVSIRKALKFNPDFAEPYLLRSKILMVYYVNYAHALEECQKGFELTKNPTEEMYDLRAKCYFELGAYEKVVEDCELILQLNYKNAKAFFYSALSKMKLANKSNPKICGEFNKAVQLGYKEAYHYLSIYCK